MARTPIARWSTVIAKHGWFNRDRGYTDQEMTAWLLEHRDEMFDRYPVMQGVTSLLAWKKVRVVEIVRAMLRRAYKAGMKRIQSTVDVPDNIVEIGE